MGTAEIQLHFLLHDVATTLVKSCQVKESLPLSKSCAIILQSARPPVGVCTRL